MNFKRVPERKDFLYIMRVTAIFVIFTTKDIVLT